MIENDLPDKEAWIEPKILVKGSLMVCGGLPKLGKSLLDLEWMRALTTGTRPFGAEEFYIPEQARVLYIEQELGKHTLKRHASNCFKRHKSHAYRDYAFFISQEPEIQIDTSKGRELLWNSVDEIKPNVLILDPISYFHSKNESDGQEIKAVLQDLAKLRAYFSDYGLSIIVTHHFRKPPTGNFARDYDPLDYNNFSGSREWGASADTLITAFRHDDYPDKSGWLLETRYVLRHGKPLNDITFKVEPENLEGQITIFKHEKEVEPIKKFTLVKKKGDEL